MNLHDIPKEQTLNKELLYSMHGLFCDIEYNRFQVNINVNPPLLWVGENDRWTFISGNYWENEGRFYETHGRGINRPSRPLDINNFDIEYVSVTSTENRPQV